MTNEMIALAPREAGQNIRKSLQAIAEVLSHGELLPAAATNVYGQLKQIEDAVKDMTSMARDRLLAFIREEGVKVTESGSLRAQFGGFEIEAKVRNTGFDPKKVQILLRQKGMGPEAGMDATITYKPNADKLNTLVRQAYLTAVELEACRFDVEYNLQRPTRVEVNVDE